MSWTSIPLKRIATLTAGGTPSVDEPTYWSDSDGGHAWSAISDMSSVDTVTTTARRISADGLRSARIKLGEPGTILFSMYASLGHTAWLKVPAAWNQAILGLLPDPTTDARFLRYSLVSLRPHLLEQARNNTQANLNAEQVGNLSIPRPLLAEQRRIADFLDAETAQIDRLLTLRSDQLRAVRERFDSVWSVSVEDVGHINGWRPLRRLLTAITDGPFGSSLASDHYSDSGARVIRLGNIGQARFRDDDAAYIPESYYQELRRHEVREGDLIVAGLGDENYPLGRACVAPGGLGHAIVKADCFRLRLDPYRIAHEYAAWVLSSPHIAGRVSEMSRGSTRSRINLSVVRGIAIPVPDLPGQHKMVASLTAQRKEVDAVSAACSLQSNLLAERRQALITAAVTGQIDVTTARGLSPSGGGAV